MGKVIVLTDSTAYIPEDLLSKYNIKTVPLSLIWGDETFQDGIDIQPDDFYKRLATAKLMPSTSQPSPMTMKIEYEKLLEEGYEICGIFISSKLSGTMDSSLQALDMIEKGNEKIEIIDSLSTSMSMGFQAIAAAKAAQTGASLSECKRIAEDARDKTGILFVVDTLEFLHRGGRIGGAQRLLGTALNFKPILELQDGKIESVEKVRTKKKAYNRMLDLLVEKIGEAPNIHLASINANAESDANSLLEKAAELLNPIETVSSVLSPVIGNHVGPGTVGIAYMTG